MTWAVDGDEPPPMLHCHDSRSRQEYRCARPSFETMSPISSFAERATSNTHRDVCFVGRAGHVIILGKLSASGLKRHASLPAKQAAGGCRHAIYCSAMPLR